MYVTSVEVRYGEEIYESSYCQDGLGAQAG